MKEPIESLITNIHQLSRPVSSKIQLNFNALNKGRKKERALTAGGKQHKYAGGSYGDIKKITESAYRVGKNIPIHTRNVETYEISEEPSAKVYTSYADRIQSANKWG